MIQQSSKVSPALFLHIIYFYVYKWYCNSYLLNLFIVFLTYSNNIHAILHNIKNHVYLYFLVASIRTVFKSKVRTKTPIYILLVVMPTDTSMFSLQISTKSILFDFNEIVFEVLRHGRLVVFENHV